MIAEGKTSKEIANLLGFTAKTAESHRSRILQKLSIHDVAGLVRLCHPLRSYPALATRVKPPQPVRTTESARRRARQMPSRDELLDPR